MDSTYRYTVLVKGVVPLSIRDNFTHLEIIILEGNSQLKGADQSALQGLLRKIWSLGFELLYVIETSTLGVQYNVGGR